MAHLHDMEELVSTIDDAQIKSYMGEALACYMAGAYRACIVLTYIALFDDIVFKLRELGAVNKKAKKIHDEALSKLESQEVYELYLIEQLKSNALLPSLDCSFLNIIRDLRNKSAHPSGHDASAEEARFVFFESVERFLSKPILSTTQLVDEISSRLDRKYLLPSDNIADISSAVKQEVEKLHPEAIPYLVNRLIDKASSDDSIVARNSRYFITGLSRLKDDHFRSVLKKYVLEEKCSDSDFSDIVMLVISADANVANDLSPVTYERLRSVFRDQIDSVSEGLEHTRMTHPVYVFLALLNVVGEDFVIDNFGELLRKLLRKFSVSQFLIDNIPKGGVVLDWYFEELCGCAGSATYSEANHASKSLKKVDKSLASLLSEEQAFLLLGNVFEAAQIGSWEADALCDSSFSSIPELKSNALNFLESGPNFVAGEDGVGGLQTASLEGVKSIIMASESDE